MSQDPQGNVLRVNFDPALVRLLREVRYFLLLPDLPIEIPANALKVNSPKAHWQACSWYQHCCGFHVNLTFIVLKVSAAHCISQLQCLDIHSLFPIDSTGTLARHCTACLKSRQYTLLLFCRFMSGM